jgi:very-short-patch-repair endonuclease
MVLQAKTPKLRRFQINAARRLRVEDTSAEELLWHELRDRSLDGWKFRRQAPITGHVVDFLCADARLTIELDGRHHAEQPLADAERRKRIEAAGYVELRFTNEDVHGRLAWVIEEVRRALDVAKTAQMRAPFPRIDP